MTVAALVVGAGRGERLRRSLGSFEGAPGGSPGAIAAEASLDLPKAFVLLAGRSLLAHSLDALAGSSEISRLVPVLPADHLADWGRIRAEMEPGTVARCSEPVAGGAQRQDSVRRGLAALPEGTTHVAVHDAARPLVTSGDVDRVVRSALRHGAALLAVPVADTIHLANHRAHDHAHDLADGEWIRETPPRRDCYAAQTPQVFRVDLLRKALESAGAEGRIGTDDAGLVAALGVQVQIVTGSADNRKITDAGDLAWAEARLAARAAAAR